MVMVGGGGSKVISKTQCGSVWCWVDRGVGLPSYGKVRSLPVGSALRYFTAFRGTHM